MTESHRVSSSVLDCVQTVLLSLLLFAFSPGPSRNLSLFVQKNIPLTDLNAKLRPPLTQICPNL